MKKKEVAGILAIILGGLGVHQFYLNRPWWGFFHIFLFSAAASTTMFGVSISWVIAWITAIVLFSMDQREFDKKYNRKYFEREERWDGRRTDYNRRDNRWESRREERQEPRQERRKNRWDRREETRRPKKETRQRKASSKPNPYKQSGIRKYKDYDYDGAIEDFKKALEVVPTDIATHFNLACAYSLSEEIDKSFYHLDRAVALGLKDTNKIKEHDALAYLRIQKEFDNFERNNYRLPAKAATKKQTETPKDDLLSTTPDLLDQLKKLGELKERGLLTEAEFAAQKRKLLK